MIVVLCFFYGAISVTAAVGNALVIYVVVVSRRMHTVTNYYIANLALGTDGPSINDVHAEGEGGWFKGRHIEGDLHMTSALKVGQTLTIGREDAWI